MVQLLIDANIDVNKRGRDEKGSGVTALHLAAEGGHLDITKLLIAAGCNVDDVSYSFPVYFGP